MDCFCSVVRKCCFTDLGFIGSPYSWSRNHLVEGRIHIRLGRALATTSWKALFQKPTVHHISMSTSDHSMLAVSLQPYSHNHQQWTQHPFQFEVMWLWDPWCTEVVQDAWNEGLYKTVGIPITNCLNSYKAQLAYWNKTEFGHMGRQITRLEKELQVLEHNL